MYRLIPYLSILLCMISSTGCDRRKDWHNASGVVWNTTYHITYRCCTNLDDSIQKCLNTVELSVSAFNKNSLVSRINRNETMVTDSIFAQVFNTSKRISRESGGLFDPTVSPLINLWGYGYSERTNRIPSDSMIASAMESVGIEQCSISTDGILTKKSPRTEFNFSALAKGFGCDEIGRMFQRNECHDYMIEIGGEVAVHGTNPHDKPWRIMIDAPIDNDSTIEHTRLTTIQITDCGVATSGNYRNYRDTSHGRTSHTISPITGYPVTIMPTDTFSLSATVIATSAMEADALATACMLMNPLDAIRIINSRPDRAILLVIKTPESDQPQTIASSNFPFESAQ